MNFRPFVAKPKQGNFFVKLSEDKKDYCSNLSLCFLLQKNNALYKIKNSYMYKFFKILLIKKKFVFQHLRSWPPVDACAGGQVACEKQYCFFQCVSLFQHIHGFEKKKTHKQ